jgi:hypothetical protein
MHQHGWKPIRLGKPVEFLLLVLAPLPCILFAQTPADQAVHEAYEQRIHHLEDRVASLEQSLARLLAAPTPPSDAVPNPVEPRTQASAPATSPRHYEPPPELVPEIGKIGAQVGVTLAASLNPFQLNRGTFAGGYIDLPLLDRPSWLHGKLSYEISVGMSQSKTTFQTTSNVAQVANLAVLDTLYPTGGLQNLTAAVSGTGPAPFPVTSSTVTRLRLLEVVPFALKYTSTSLDHWRLRPYGVIGFGTYVTIHNQNPASGSPPNYGVRPDATLPPDVLALVSQLFGGQAPFGGPLVAGQLSQSPELEARGLPGGHGNIDLGIHTGFGLEYRVSRSLAIGFDGRYNRIAGTNGNLLTFGSRIGVYF